MMISKKLEEALNDQMNKELYSAYLYLGMATHFESEGLKGFARWMRVQAHEEQTHAMKLYDYLFAVDGKPVLKAIKEATTQYEKTPLEVIQEVSNLSPLQSTSCMNLPVKKKIIKPKTSCAGLLTSKLKKKQTTVRFWINSTISMAMPG